MFLRFVIFFFLASVRFLQEGPHENRLFASLRGGGEVRMLQVWGSRFRVGVQCLGLRVRGSSLRLWLCACCIFFKSCCRSFVFFCFVFLPFQFSCF